MILLNHLKETAYDVLMGASEKSSEPFWIDLVTSEKRCSRRCYSWHASKYRQFNLHVKNWRHRPSFRYTNCLKSLPFICEQSRAVKNDCESSNVVYEKR